MLKTTDGGVSWQVKYSTDNFRNLYCIDFINHNTGWVCGYRGIISRTTNSGDSWEVQRDVPAEAYYTIKFVNGNTGWAAGDNSAVVLTTNGGLTWSNSNLAATRFIDIQFINENTGWMIGLHGMVYKTTNNGGLTGINSFQNLIPNYQLSQNYPNPFNPITVIKYNLPVSGSAAIKVFDVLGNEVMTLVDQKQNAGSYEVEFNGNNLTSGIYFYTFFNDNKKIDTKRMILLK